MARTQGRLGALFVDAPSTDPQNTTLNTTNAVEIGQIRGYDLDLAVDVEDVTDLGDKWREVVATLRGWSGTFTGFLDPSNAVNHDEIMEALMEADFSGSLATTAGEQDAQLLGIFRLDDSQTGGSKPTLYGNMTVLGVRPGVNVEGVNGFTVTFQGSGKLGYTAAG